MHDIHEVREVLNYLQVEKNVQVDQPVRLGRKDAESSKPSLLRVTIDSTSEKQNTLTKAKQLKGHEMFGRICITPDLTPKERDVNRKL